MSKKKIRAAYKLGAEGEPHLPNAPFSHRVAHRLGKQSLARSLRGEAEFDKRAWARLEAARRAAKGLNDQALTIIADASMIPNQAASNPLSGNGWRDSDGNDSWNWLTFLSSGQDTDPSRPSKTPLAAPLGVLDIDSSEWAHNGLHITVHNLSIAVSAPVDMEGKFGAASTTIHINSTEYDPDAYFPDIDQDYTGGVRIDLDGSGSITAIGLTRGHVTGYENEDPSKIQLDLGGFLQSVDEAVLQTVKAYQDLPS